MISTMEVLAALAIVLTVVYFIKRHYSVWKYMGAPHEDADMFYGNLKNVGKSESMTSCMQKIYDKYQGSAPFVGIFVFFKPAALVLDLELVKNIMIKDFNYFSGRGIYVNEEADPLTAHIFNIHGQKWRSLRTKLTPTFTSGKMKIMFSSVVAVSLQLQKKINALCEVDQEIDITGLMARFTTDVIGTVVFGIACNSLNEDDNHFYKMGLRIFNNPRHSFPMQLLLLSFQNLARTLGIKRYHDDMSSFFMQIIRSTVDYRLSNEVQRKDFMNLLLELHRNAGDNHITFNELAAQAFVFFAAGFDTSSSLLQFCLVELACHADIQQKAREHIETVITKHNGQFTYEAMIEMKYIDEILNETLRMYPPVAILSRETDRDYQVPGTSFMFKKGTLAIISAYAIQRDPILYPDPHTFNPENCSEQNMKKRPICANLSFGEGPRNCIGARFGMMQSRIGLIAVLRNYHFELSPKTKIPLELSPKTFTTSIVGGVWLKVSRIN